MWDPFGLHAATRSPLHALAQWLVADPIFVRLVQGPSRAGAMHVLNAMHPIRRSVAGGPCASVLSAYDHASIVLLALVAVSAYDPASTVLVRSCRALVAVASKGLSTRWAPQAAIPTSRSKAASFGPDDTMLGKFTPVLRWGCDHGSVLDGKPGICRLSVGFFRRRL